MPPLISEVRSVSRGCSPPRTTDIRQRTRRRIVISSLKRAVLGAVAACLVAVALVASLGYAGVGPAAAAADVLPGDSTCVPIKGQTPRPDLIPVGLTPAGTEVVVKNVGCGPHLNAFNVW